MAFIQIVEFRTSRFDEGQKFVDEYRAATEGKRTTTRVRVGEDRDHPGHYGQGGAVQPEMYARRIEWLPYRERTSRMAH